MRIPQTECPDWKWSKIYSCNFTPTPSPPIGHIPDWRVTKEHCCAAEWTTFHAILSRGWVCQKPPKKEPRCDYWGPEEVHEDVKGSAELLHITVPLPNMGLCTVISLESVVVCFLHSLSPYFLKVEWKHKELMQGDWMSSLSRLNRCADPRGLVKKSKRPT